MQLIPDVTTAYIDPFRVEKTLVMVFDICNPRTGEMYSGPAQVAKKAEKYLASTGIADTAFFAPEAEFYIFDDVRYEFKPNALLLQGRLRRGRLEHRPRAKRAATSATRPRTRAATSRSRPIDKQADLRDDICLELIEAGLIVERAHHEVGTAGQAEINYRFDTLVHAADDILKFKYIVKNIADAVGQDRDVHAEAALRRQRLGHAHPPVAVERRHAAVLRREGLRRPVRHRPLVHRRPAQARRRRCWPSPTRR